MAIMATVAPLQTHRTIASEFRVSEQQQGTLGARGILDTAAAPVLAACRINTGIYNDRQQSKPFNWRRDWRICGCALQRTWRCQFTSCHLVSSRSAGCWAKSTPSNSASLRALARDTLRQNTKLHSHQVVCLGRFKDGGRELPKHMPLWWPIRPLPPAHQFQAISLSASRPI